MVFPFVGTGFLADGNASTATGYQYKLSPVPFQMEPWAPALVLQQAIPKMGGDDRVAFGKSFKIHYFVLSLLVRTVLFYSSISPQRMRGGKL
jgi:hypothetical protein